MLAELLRGQPYKSPISNCSMSSAIVPRFGVCSWDESLVGAVSRWPFLQSLILFFSFVPVFPLDRTILGKNFEMGGWSHPSTGGRAYLLEVVSSGSLSPLMHI